MFRIGLYICVVVCSILLCSVNNDSVSTNQRSSSCGGFVSLSKHTLDSYVHDSLDYCEAEKIRWSYDSISAVLCLLHTRQLANCAAKLKMYVTYQDGVYNIEERDERNSKIGAKCMCYFDTYCELLGIQDSACTLSYKGQVYYILTTGKKGAFELTTSTDWECY